GPRASHALGEIKTRGLPNRRVEAWHYTDLRNLLKEFPGPVVSTQAEAKAALAAIPSQFACIELPIIDGVYYPGFATTLPQKVLLASQSPSVNASKLAADDAIGLLNSGLAKDGLTIVVNDDAQIEDMVSLTHIATGEGSSATRHNVKIGAGASAIFIERHLCATENSTLTNTVCDLELGDGAIATWVIDQRMSTGSTRFGQLNVKLGKNADLTILSLNSGCRLVRQEINVEVAGEGADLKIRGVNLVADNSHIDVTTKLDHLVPDTISNEIFRNVVVGRGHGVFQGQINVAQVAQRTDARMACNSLLLSDFSEFSAKPELEIFADDVQCAHGATVTDIDEEQLFYLMARGIPEKQSRELLITAFVEEVFDGLEVEHIGEGLNARIEEWLADNG
ncbi:MAG: Fe-S cluster assembly protein SufD, partial [Rhizobiaceae bacterium]|nr:Fe-S cluster assembly protein SufD [Rhizobiaceae bacterium]